MNINTQEALEKLRQGYQSFLAQSATPVSNQAHIQQLYENGQHPFATVVTCSDSRVSPEILFSCQLGDIFTVRTAGHVLSAFELASIEYAVDHLHTPLVLILGHSHCGAVKSSATPHADAHHSHAMQALVDEISPAIEAAKRQSSASASWMRLAEDIHIERMLRKVAESEAFMERASILMAAKYDIESANILYLKSLSRRADGQLEILKTTWA